MNNTTEETWKTKKGEVSLSDMSAAHLKNSYKQIIEVANQKLEKFAKASSYMDHLTTESNKLFNVLKSKQALEKEILTRIGEENNMQEVDKKIFLTQLLKNFTFPEIIDVLKTEFNVELQEKVKKPVKTKKIAIHV